jgi:hypothetical protein
MPLYVLWRLRSTDDIIGLHVTQHFQAEVWQDEFFTSGTQPHDQNSGSQHKTRINLLLGRLNL